MRIEELQKAREQILVQTAAPLFPIQIAADVRGLVFDEPRLVLIGTEIVIQRLCPFLKFRIESIYVRGVLIHIIVSPVLKTDEYKARIVLVFFIVHIVPVLNRDDAVIGEGYLTRTEQSATAYITFASEGRLTAEMSNNMGEKNYRLNRFENGVCNYTIEENRTSTFAMTSHIPNDVTVVLQLPKRSATWTPLNFPENTVETASSWNVSVEVPANGKVDLPLTVKNSGEFRGERTKDCRTAIQNAIDGGLIGEDSAALFKQYLEALDKREEINLRLGNIKSQLNSLHEEERTLARSLAGLKDIKGANANALKEQFIARQKDNEKRLADKTTEQYALQGEKSDIDLMIRSLEPTLKYSVN